MHWPRPYDTAAVCRKPCFRELTCNDTGEYMLGACLHAGCAHAACAGVGGRNEVLSIEPLPGWTPDPPMVGIRSPICLVVGSCTSHPGVLGSIPKREEPGKTGAPCFKVPGSSRVPVIKHTPSELLYISYRSCSNKTHPDRPLLVVSHR